MAIKCAGEVYTSLMNFVLAPYEKCAVGVVNIPTKCGYKNAIKC